MTPPEEIWLIKFINEQASGTTLTLDNKALKQRLQAQIDSACAFGVWHRFMRCERFRVNGWKRYVNDDRFHVDGDKNMRLLAFAFTIVFVWTGP